MSGRMFRLKFRFLGWELDMDLDLHRDRVRTGAVRSAMLLIPAAMLYMGATITTQPPHDFAGGCFNCHYTVPTQGEHRPYRFVAPVSELCIRCHKGLESVSHFVDSTTVMSYGHRFPVTTSIFLTCATCHDPHMLAQNPSSGKKTYMLRMGASGRTACVYCHKGPDTAAGVETRRHVMDRAHGVANFEVLTSFTMDYEGRRLDIKDKTVTLDKTSVFCLGCHDDPSNPELTRPGSKLYRHATDNGLSHPLGISYDEAAWNNKELRLKDRDTRLPLFGGKIGCCTCHDPYAVGGGTGLRLGDRTDWHELCEACHLR